MEIIAQGGKRNHFLYLVLAITLGLTAWMALHKQEDSGSEDLLAEGGHTPSAQPISVRKTVNQSQAVATDETTRLGMHQRNPIKREIKDLFNVHSWYVPPPVKKVPAPPPPAPTAPPVPFVYVGKLEDPPGVSSIFLMNGNRLYAIKKGENVNAEWRLDAEDAQSLSFTYLPLGLPQTLSKLARANPIEAPIEAQNTQ